MATRKTSRLYFGLNDTNSVKHFKTLILASLIGKSTLMCKDCVTTNIEDLNRTVDPDPKIGPKLKQKRAIISLPAKVVKPMDL